MVVLFKVSLGLTLVVSMRFFDNLSIIFVILTVTLSIVHLYLHERYGRVFLPSETGGCLYVYSLFVLALAMFCTSVLLLLRFFKYL